MWVGQHPPTGSDMPKLPASLWWRLFLPVKAPGRRNPGRHWHLVVLNATPLVSHTHTPQPDPPWPAGPRGQHEHCQAPSETSADRRNACGQLQAQTQDSERLRGPEGRPSLRGPSRLLLNCMQSRIKPNAGLARGHLPSSSVATGTKMFTLAPHLPSTAGPRQRQSRFLLTSAGRQCALGVSPADLGPHSHHEAVLGSLSLCSQGDLLTHWGSSTLH